MKREGMKFNYLPEEVICEILCRLPIKSILQCLCVCKLWYSLIKNPNFISFHFQSNKTTNHYFLCEKFGDEINRYSLRIDNDNLEENMTLQIRFDFTDYNYSIVGSCNGLICFFSIDSKYGYRIILWNPPIRKSLLLPLPTSVLKIPSHSYREFIGLGFDSRTRDYKVLRILYPKYTHKSHFKAELYSLNSNSWKDITHTAPNKYVTCEHLTPAFVNGALHWIVKNYLEPSYSMMVFNMSDDVFHEIALPECFKLCSFLALKITALQESSIAIIWLHSNYESSIWVMKEYGVGSSWLKLSTIVMGTQQGRSLSVLGFRNNGDALVQCERCGNGRQGCLASQKLNSPNVNALIMTMDSYLYIHDYVESLVFFDKGDDTRM